MLGRKRRIQAATDAVRHGYDRALVDAGVVLFQQIAPGVDGHYVSSSIATALGWDATAFREAGTLRREIAVTLDEAVLGGKVRVPTLDGPVTLTVPPKSSGGRTLRLKGKGLPRAGGRGDLLVTLKIVLPEDGDAELEALMKKWREGKRYSVRDEASET